MSEGIITLQGRIFKAGLWYASDLYCAVGQGDGTFTNPLSPPLENASQTGLLGEKARKLFGARDYLVEDPVGAIQMGGRRFSVSANPSAIVLFQWTFDFNEANVTWKEIGYFGGAITYGQFYGGAAPPVASGIAGITINFVSNNNGVGTGLLTFTVAGTTLTWRAPGSATPGTPVNIGSGGNFTLADGVTATKIIRVAVTAGSLPGGNASQSPALTAAGASALNGLNSTTNPTGQIDSNGDLIYVRNIADQIKTNANQRSTRLLIEP